MEFLLVTHTQILMPIKIEGFFENKLLPSDYEPSDGPSFQALLESEVPPLMFLRKIQTMGCLYELASGKLAWSLQTENSENSL